MSIDIMDKLKMGRFDPSATYGQFRIGIQRGPTFHHQPSCPV